MKSLVSVIVPVFNVEKYLEDCVTSIKEQTYSNLEIILVDDGSTDSSGTICDLLQEQDSRIKVIHQKNEGLPSARNTGLKHATGEWILFVDSDDAIVTDCLEKLLGMVQKYSNIEIVIFNLQRVTDISSDIKCLEEGDTIKLTPKQVIDLTHDVLDPMSEKFELLHEGKVTAWNKLYNRKFLEENNLFFYEEVKVHEDIPFSFAVFSRAKEIVFVNEKYYLYRYNPQSITNTYRPFYGDELRALIKRLQIIGSKADRGLDFNTDLDNRIIASTINLLIKCLCNKDNKFSYAERKNKYEQWKQEMRITEKMKNADYKSFQLKKRIAAYFLKIDNFWLLNLIFRLKK